MALSLTNFKAKTKEIEDIRKFNTTLVQKF